MRRAPLWHGLADLHQRAGDAGGHLAVVHQRVGVVCGDHVGVARHRVGVELLDRNARRDRAHDLADDANTGDTSACAAIAGPDKHHQVVVGRVLGAVGEHDAAAHAVPEHDLRQSRVLAAAMPTRVPKSPVYSDMLLR